MASTVGAIVVASQLCDHVRNFGKLAHGLAKFARHLRPFSREIPGGS